MGARYCAYKSRLGAPCGQQLGVRNKSGYCIHHLPKTEEHKRKSKPITAVESASGQGERSCETS